MELQFYGPGYVPQFEGFGCTAHQYCAAMTIDSRTLDQNTGIENTARLQQLHPRRRRAHQLGLHHQERASPRRRRTRCSPARSTSPNFSAVNPDLAKDLLMSPGDRIRIHMHDTRRRVADRPDRPDAPASSGSMTASVANGFGHILYTPNSDTCQAAPYAFHPEYSTGEPARKHLVGAHVQRGDVRRDRALRELPASSTRTSTAPSPAPRTPQPRRGRRQQLLRPRHRLDAGEDQRLLQRATRTSTGSPTATTGRARTRTRSWTGCCTRRRCCSPAR